MFLFGVLDIFSNDERLIEKHLLAFGLTNLVLCPYLGRIPLVPIEACAKRELFHRLANDCILPVYTRTRKSQGSPALANGLELSRPARQLSAENRAEAGSAPASG